jgi:hypothetical protein
MSEREDGRAIISKRASRVSEPPAHSGGNVVHGLARRWAKIQTPCGDLRKTVRIEDLVASPTEPRSDVLLVKPRIFHNRQELSRGRERDLSRQSRAEGR